MQTSDPTPPPAEPVRVVRVYRPARIVPFGSAEYQRARYRGWAITTWVAFLFMVWLLLLVGIAWLARHGGPRS